MNFKNSLFVAFFGLTVVFTTVYWNGFENYVYVGASKVTENRSSPQNILLNLSRVYAGRQVDQAQSSSCENLLANLTKGRWVLTEPNKTHFYDDILARYRLKKGIPQKLWRDDGKCGFKKLVVLCFVHAEFIDGKLSIEEYEKFGRGDVNKRFSGIKFHCPDFTYSPCLECNNCFCKFSESNPA